MKNFSTQRKHTQNKSIKTSIANRQKIGEMPKSIIGKFWSITDSSLVIAEVLTPRLSYHAVFVQVGKQML